MGTFISNNIINMFTNQSGGGGGFFQPNDNVGVENGAGQGYN